MSERQPNLTELEDAEQSARLAGFAILAMLEAGESVETVAQKLNASREALARCVQEARESPIPSTRITGASMAALARFVEHARALKPRPARRFDA